MVERVAFVESKASAFKTQVAVLVSLCTASFECFAQSTVQTAKAEFIHQFRSCTITTDVPIYNEKRGSVCGVESATPYSDSSCPVATYQSCIDESHGVAAWEDATATPGAYPSRWEDGENSVDGCLAKGEAWIAAGSRGVRGPGPGFRHRLISVDWEAEDIRDPIFNNRVRARHRCTYHYGFDRAVYARARSAACGVESRQDCRIRTVYNSCRDASFGIEAYKQATGRFTSCGYQLERGYITLLYNGDLIAKAIFAPVDTSAGKIRADCPDVSSPVDRHRCIRVNRAALALVEPINTAYAVAVVESLRRSLDQTADQIFIQALSTGDIRSQYDKMWDTYIKEGFSNGNSGSENFFHDVNETVPRIPDTIYFPLTLRLATQTLTKAPIVDIEADSVVYFSPLYRLITDVDLESRRIKFKTISDLLVLLRAADPKASPQMRGQVFVLNEYLARLTANYVNQRAYDIVKLQADAASVRTNATLVDTTVEAVIQRVRDMQLRPELEATALQQLQAVKAGSELQTTIRDLIMAAKSDVTSTISAVETYTQDSIKRDELLRANMANVHLLRGNINHAVLQLRESGVAFNMLSAKEEKASYMKASLARLRSNLVSSIKTSLAQSRAALNKLRSGSELSLDMLVAANGQKAVPFELVDALIQTNVMVGDKLDGVRLQLVSQIASNVVDPLQGADTELSK